VFVKFPVSVVLVPQFASAIVAGGLLFNQSPLPRIVEIIGHLLAALGVEVGNPFLVCLPLRFLILKAFWRINQTPIGITKVQHLVVIQIRAASR
jgi:hypothetical protein